MTPLKLIETQAFIDGQWIAGDRAFEVLDPATGAVIAKVADLGPDETRTAIAAAHRAFSAWAGQTAKARGAILRRWSDLMLAHADDLARLMTAEQGKPLAEAKGEVAYGAAFIDWFADEAKRAYGHTIPTPMPGKRLASIKGIGRKTAERIVVELRDKINPIEALANSSTAASKEQSAVLRDAMLALSALGFSEEIARAKVQQVLAADPSLSDTQAILKKALAS